MPQQPIQITAEQANQAVELLTSKDIEISDLRNQLIQAELQFTAASKEHQDLMKDCNLHKSIHKKADKKSVELAMQVNQLNQAMLERELEFSKIKIELYESMLHQHTVSTAKTAANNNASGDTIKSISKIPTFEGKSIAFNCWINGVTEIFDNYPLLKDFQKRAIAVESLKGSARDWYDAEPDDNVSSWKGFKAALMSQYDSMESTDHAFERIDLKLTCRICNQDLNPLHQSIAR